jgi:hypothetical protein
MSVDTVNYALTTVTKHIRDDQGNSFSAEGKKRLLDIADCMRSYLIVEDVQNFNWYVDTSLGKHPDTMDYLLEELFEHLNIKTRDELSVILAAE